MKFNACENIFYNESLLKKKNIVNHPVFDIAEQGPVFLVNGKVYYFENSLDNEENNKRNYIKKGFFKPKLNELVEVGDISSLDEIYLSRSDKEINEIKEDFSKKIQENILERDKSNYKIVEFIYLKIFPYLRGKDNSKKISKLLGVDNVKDKDSLEKKVSKTSR